MPDFLFEIFAIIMIAFPYILIACVILLTLIWIYGVVKFFSEPTKEKFSDTNLYIQLIAFILAIVVVGIFLIILIELPKIWQNIVSALKNKNFQEALGVVLVGMVICFLLSRAPVGDLKKE